MLFFKRKHFKLKLNTFIFRDCFVNRQRNKTTLEIKKIDTKNKIFKPIERFKTIIF